ncbi:MAG: hypothetical protein IT235_08995 [Bacteroidia bacterium]|nr:hypothetical protein [Bacteroidia bacterium]
MRKIILYLVLSVCFIYTAREFIYYGLRKNSIGEFDKLNTIFVKQNSYDVLIVGSSRAESHFVPSIIDSVIGLSCFNAGQGGATQEFNLAILNSYLLHSQPPKILVLNIDIHLPDTGIATVYQFPKYFAYLGNDTLYSYLNKFDKRFTYFKWIPFYSMVYLSDYYLSASLRGWMGKQNENDKTYINGFTPEKKWVEDVEQNNYRTINNTFSPTFYKSINAILTICMANHIKPVLVVSPLYSGFSEMIANKQKTLEMLQKLSTKNAAVLMDFTDDAMCAQKKYFTNPRHLNIEGARIFSKKFAELLQRHLE